MELLTNPRPLIKKDREPDYSVVVCALIGRRDILLSVSRAAGYAVLLFRRESHQHHSDDECDIRANSADRQDRGRAASPQNSSYSTHIKAIRIR
jgi:hypothetical protein